MRGGSMKGRGSIKLVCVLKQVWMRAPRPLSLIGRPRDGALSPLVRPNPKPSSPTFSGAPALSDACHGPGSAKSECGPHKEPETSGP